MNPINLDIPVPNALMESQGSPITNQESLAARVNLVILGSVQKTFGGMWQGYVPQDKMNAQLTALADTLSGGDSTGTIMALMQIAATARAVAFAAAAPTALESVLWARAWDNMLHREALTTLSDEELLAFEAVEDILPDYYFDIEEFDGDRALLAAGKCPCAKHRAEAGEDVRDQLAQVRKARGEAIPEGLEASRVMASMPPEMRVVLEALAQARGLTSEQMAELMVQDVLAGKSADESYQAFQGGPTVIPLSETSGIIESPIGHEPDQSDVERIAREVSQSIPNLTDVERERVRAKLAKMTIEELASGKPIEINYGDDAE